MSLPEGSGRYDSVHGDENEKLALDLDAALEDVVETIMLFGQYPQPSQRDRQRVQFQLDEYLSDHYWDEESVLSAYEAYLTQFSTAFDDKRMRESARLQENLTEHLRNSVIVREHAERVAQQKKEDGE